MTMPRGRDATRTVLAAIASILAGAEPALADLIEWTAPGDGSFHNASNWSPGMVPGSNDLAGFDQSDTTSTITFNGDAQTLSLELAAGDYTFDLRGHTYAFVDIAAPINLVGTDGYALTFIDGTVTSWSAAMFGTGDWTIGDGATVDLMSQLVMAGASNDLFIDGGTLTSQSARIGDFAASDANLWITGGGLLSLSTTLRVGHLAGADGFVSVGGAGSRLEASNEIIAGSAGSAWFAVTELAEANVGKATFGGSGSADVDVLDGGTMTISTDLSVGSGAVMEIANLGVVDVGGETSVSVFGVLDLQSGGTLHTSSLDVDGTFAWGAGSTLEIDGILVVEPDGGLGDTIIVEDQTLRVDSLYIDSPVGSGLVDVNGGTLDVEFELALGCSAGHLRVRGDTAGTVTIGQDLNVECGGELDVEAGGTLTVADTIFVSPDGLVDLKPGSELRAAHGVNRANFHQLGGLVLIGDDLPAGATSGFIVNGVAEEPVFFNEASGQLVTTDSAIGTGAGGRALLMAWGDWFCAALDVGRSGGPADAARVEIQALVNATDDVTIHESGLIHLELSSAQLFAPRVENHGRLVGTGDVLADVVNAGEIAVSGFELQPGGNTPGMRILPAFGAGSFEQTAAGTLAIDLFSASIFDRLRVDVPTQLAGTLEVTLADGYAPPPGTTFEIIDTLGAPDAVITGTFDAIEPAGFEAIYLGDSVIVRVVEVCSGDFDGSGDVGFADLAQLLAAWGPCAGDCALDLDGSGDVGFSDLAQLLAGWGMCP